MNREKTLRLVQYALVIAVIMLLGVFNIGYINVGAIEITIVHIPVIVGAILFGAKGGAVFGFIFGLSSLLRAFKAPTMLSMLLLGVDTGFGWYNLLLIVMVIFVPRILVGIVAGLISHSLLPRMKSNVGAIAVSAAAGTLTNTVFFLGLLYILAVDMLASAFGTTAAGVATLLFTVTGLVNGGIELAAAVIICVAVCKPLMKHVSPDPRVKVVK